MKFNIQKNGLITVFFFEFDLLFYEFDNRDFVLPAGSQGRAPGAGAARGINRIIAFLIITVVIFAVNQAGNEIDREDLAAMSVAGKLQADAGFFRVHDERGLVVKQDVGGVFIHLVENGRIAL